MGDKKFTAAEKRAYLSARLQCPCRMYPNGECSDELKQYCLEVGWEIEADLTQGKGVALGLNREQADVAATLAHWSDVQRRIWDTRREHQGDNLCP